MSEKEIREQVIVYLKETFGVGAYASLVKEYAIHIGSSACRADLAFLCHNTPIVLVECKRLDADRKGKSQLTSYLLASACELGILSVGSTAWSYYRKNRYNQIRELCQSDFEASVNKSLDKQNRLFRQKRKRYSDKKSLHSHVDTICKITSTPINDKHVSITLENQRVFLNGSRVRCPVSRVRLESYDWVGDVLDDSGRGVCIATMRKDVGGILLRTDVSVVMCPS